MSSTSTFRGVMTLLADSITATASSLWPWSAASIEARRIAADGYAAGQVADVYYLVSFDEAAPEPALAAIRGAGFAVLSCARMPAGFSVSGRRSAPVASSAHPPNNRAVRDKMVRPAPRR